MTIRRLTYADMDLLIRLRIDFLQEAGMAFDEEALLAMQQKCREFFVKSLRKKTFIAFVAQHGEEILSVAFLAIHEHPPRRAFEPFRVGTVYNVLTYPVYRRRGIATKVLTALLNEARAMGIPSVDLLATQDGAPLYETLGFRPISHTPMRIALDCGAAELPMADEKTLLLSRLALLHTTPLGVQRIRRNLGLDVPDVVAWCRAQIQAPQCSVIREGKNWYARAQGGIISVNANSNTIITAHPIKA